MEDSFVRWKIFSSIDCVVLQRMNDNNNNSGQQKTDHLVSLLLKTIGVQLHFFGGVGVGGGLLVVAVYCCWWCFLFGCVCVWRFGLFSLENVLVV